MGVREDRSSGGLKFVLALEALIHVPIRAGSALTLGVRPGLTLLRKLGDPYMVTTEASNAVRPSGGLEVIVAGLFVREELLNCYQAGSDSVGLSVHGSIMP